MTVKEPDMAIAMYKRAKQYDNMIRLVKQFHADLLQDTYIHVAKEIESEGKHKQAEHYYIEGEYGLCTILRPIKKICAAIATFCPP